MTIDRELTLGEYLRHEREDRCITIEQVASATKVGVRTLHSLEEDHFSELPAKPFIRGFVTAYCRFIGLDAKEVLSRYDDFITKKANERPSREGGHSGYAFDRKDGEQQGRTKLLLAICSFILFGGIAMLLLKPSLRHHRRSHMDQLRDAHPLPSPVASPGSATALQPPMVPLVWIQPTSVPSAFVRPAPVVTPLATPVVTQTHSPVVTSTATPTPALTPAPTPLPSVLPSLTPIPPPQIKPSPLVSPSVAAAVAGANPSDPLDSGTLLKASEIRHKAVFHVLDDIWVRYRVDERPVRKFIIRKGNKLILRAADRIQVQISNPDSVSYSYNGREFHPVSQDKNLNQVQGDATLFFPTQLGETVTQPFGNERALPRTPDPKPQVSPVASQDSSRAEPANLIPAE
jgi:cytoskeleton protein RodZ